jgi:hypothetical protein
VVDISRKEIAMTSPAPTHYHESMGAHRKPSRAPAPRSQHAAEIAPPLGRPLPCDTRAEEHVLGGSLLDDQCFLAARETLKPEDFSRKDNETTFRAMLLLNESSCPLGETILIDKLKRLGQLEVVGGSAFVEGLTDMRAPTEIMRFREHVRIVKDKAILRSVIHKTYAIQQQAMEAVDDANTILGRLADTAAALSASSPTKWTQKLHTVEELPCGEPKFLIEGILPEGVTFTGALSGEGKTWFCISMALALTTGKPFLGAWKVPEPVHCLYLVPEMNAARFGKRCRRFGICGDRFRCMTLSDGEPLDLSDPLLAAAIRELKPVVFLDTAIRFSSAEEENSASQNAQGLAKAIFKLLHLGARAVVCLHHRAKGTAGSEVMTLENTLRGSGDLGAMADAVWGLQYDRGDGSAQYLRESRHLVRLVVRCVKARDFSAPEDFRVQLDPYLDQTGNMGVLENEFVNLRLTETQRLSAAIEVNPRCTKADLEKATNIGRNRIEGLASEIGWLYKKRAGWHRRIT